MTTDNENDPAPSPSRRVAAVERATDVLFAFVDGPTDDDATLGVTEIANHLGVSKAVVHRILTSYTERDLIVADPATHRYALGPAVLRLASAYLDHLDVRALSLEAMRHISTETNETTTLSVLHGDQRVYVDQVTPNREVKMTVQLASAFPLHAGSSSKAFLAWLGEREIDRYLADHDLDALTDVTITSADELRDELAAIRRRGYATSLGERQAGAGSVAAPLIDHTGMPVAVISVCGPLERFRDHIDEHTKVLVAATDELSARLGAPPR